MSKELPQELLLEHQQKKYFMPEGNGHLFSWPVLAPDCPPKLSFGVVHVESWIGPIILEPLTFRACIRYGDEKQASSQTSNLTC